MHRDQQEHVTLAVVVAVVVVKMLDQEILEQVELVVQE
tara:strand:+ start:574 stop:687 length:114 start_codon:yes stop_codon:yes gene_type:complete